MKKILSAILLIAMSMFMLIGCAEDEIGKYIDQYEKPQKKENITLNLYVISEPSTTAVAQTTVIERIKNYTAQEYNTTLNVVYCSEADYASVVTNATVAGVDATNRADIFLINSPELMSSLYADGRLADLTDFLHNDKINKVYGSLNAQIASSLLNASRIEEEVLVAGTQNQYETVAKNYCIPNNRVIGKYEYLLIHRDTAEAFYMGSASQLASIKYGNDSYTELVGKIEDAIESGTLSGQLSDYVRKVTGNYEDKVKYENGLIGDGKKYACNIESYPKVVGLSNDNTVISDQTFIENGVNPETVENVFNSVFAINKETNVERAMEILYAINTDDILHNYLQYGIASMNYTLNEGIVNPATGENFYKMNSQYTGDIFKILYSEIWTSEDAANGIIQNSESVVYVIPEE